MWITVCWIFVVCLNTLCESLCIVCLLIVGFSSVCSLGARPTSGRLPSPATVSGWVCWPGVCLTWWREWGTLRSPTELLPGGQQLVAGTPCGCHGNCHRDKTRNSCTHSTWLGPLVACVDLARDGYGTQDNWLYFENESGCTVICHTLEICYACKLWC